MLRKALEIIELQAGVSVDALDASAFATEVDELMSEVAPYWRPSSRDPTGSGAEFWWPNGSFIGIERSLGKWFLETDEELFPLTSTKVEDMAVEIDSILREKGYDAWLGDTEMRFDQMTETKW